ncbi:MAG: chemotaxis protein CheV [Acidihalobacter sp.]|jgi:two-component system, chemotaxis family, chemotaxis protein CheV|uniref:chemotaxis protein CheV n=1 Tax=Acidihalobacter sp. TaxID=1872108 RepID=UPI00307F63CA
MSNILNSVDQRTQLAGQNRLELLLFKIDARQLFAINVFKVREVIPEPKYKPVPQAHPYVLGIADIRGHATPLIALASPLGRHSQVPMGQGFIIVTEFNRMVQGFRVDAVDRIINISWEAVLPPPNSSRSGHYMTAVTQHEDQLIEILDVERILADVRGISTEVSENLRNEAATVQQERPHRVLVVDDSSVARLQVRRTLEQIGVEVELANDGREALEKLEAMAAQSAPEEWFDAVVSDIEMPRMDGYTLCSSLRANERLAKLPIILHTSLSGSFNQAMIERVGANGFLPKFQPDELASTVLKLLEQND